MNTQRLLPRWFRKAIARATGTAWRLCPHCQHYFGAWECDKEAKHINDLPLDHDGALEFIPLCPTCVARGVGCRANADHGRYHYGCAYAIAPREDTTPDAR